MFICGICSEKYNNIRIKNILERVVKLHCILQLQYDIVYYCCNGFGLVTINIKGRNKYKNIYISGSHEYEIVLGLQGSVVGYYESDSLKRLFNLYIKHGNDFVQELDGNFNIIIFNMKDEVLNVYNDIYASNKFYYKETEKDCYFATNMKSVLLIDKILNQKIPAIDVSSLMELCWYGHCLRENTLFDSINCLPFASNLHFKDRLVINNYWSPKYDVRKREENVDFTKKIVNAMTSSLQRRFHCLNNQSIGISLSGGLDSRLIASGAELIGLKPKTYTYGNRDSRDLMVGRKVAESLGFDNIQVDLESYDITYGRRFAVWQCEGEIWTLGPVYHKELIRNGIKFKVSGNGMCGAFLGGYIHPNILLPLSEQRSIEKLFYNKGVISEEFLKKIFTKNYYSSHFDNLKREFINSFNEIEEKVLYKKNEIWEFIYRVTRGVFSNKVDQYYFNLNFPYNDKMFVELWLTLPLYKKILQNCFKKAIFKSNKKTQSIPYGLTGYRLQNNILSEIIVLGLHHISGKIKSKLKKYYSHPGKEIIDLRQQIIKDRSIRKDIERFMAADYFPNEVFDRNGIAGILAAHYKGSLDASKTISFLVNIATVYEYFIDLKGEIPNEVVMFTEELLIDSHD